MRRGLIVCGLAVLVTAVGCDSKVPGETSTAPPPGGPKASAKHPPGESQSVIDREGR